MFTDLAGYSAQTHADEGAAIARLEAQNRLIRPVLLAHRGRLVKTMGDGLLVEFPNALDAVECAVDLQRRSTDPGPDSAGRPLRLRVGVHVGDVERRGSDILGDAVNVASRIEPLAEPGGVCLSAQVYDQVHNKVAFQLERLGPQRLKGIPEPVEVYRVRLPWLRPGTAAGVSGGHRLAVLPLANISPDPKDEYFADGLTEELIAVLSALPDLRVIARTSVGQYKATSKTIAQIGAELNVNSVLEGSVRKLGNRIRITMQLIDTGTQEHIWADSYNRDLDDVFAIQADIAARTAEALRLKLLAAKAKEIARRPTPNLAAYDLYLRGLYAAHRTAMAGLIEAIHCFEQATHQDPEFSLAYSHWANGLILLAGDWVAPGPALARARGLLDRALELEPESPEAHATLANLILQSERDWPRAEREFRHALELNPSDANAQNWYGVLLAVVQRFAEAKERFGGAVALDPRWPLPLCWLIEVHERLGEFERAAALAEEALAKGLEQRPWLHGLLGIAYAQTGRRDAAEREVDLAAGGRSEPELLGLAALLARLGQGEAVLRLAREREAAAGREYVPAAMLAGLWAAAGESPKAFEWLERDMQGAEAERGLWFDYLSPCFDRLRGDPRFGALLRESNLSPEVGWTPLFGPGTP
jgi:adenylate cyclase